MQIQALGRAFEEPPLATEGLLEASKDSSRSEIVIGEEDARVGLRFLLQKTSKRVVTSSHPECPHRPPAEEDRPPGVTKPEVARQPEAKEGGSSRGLNVRQRVKRLRCRGPSVFLHTGLIESRSGGDRQSNGSKEQECVPGVYILSYL